MIEAPPPPSRAARNEALLWMIGAQVCFALMNVSARAGARDVPWQEVAAARFFMGTLVAFAWARVRGSSLRIANQRLAWRRTAFGTLAAATTFYTLASREMPVGDGVTLVATAPIFVALLSYPLLGERVRASVFVAIALSFVGVVAVARPSFHAAAHVGTIALCSAVCSAFAMIQLRRLGPGESAEAVVLHFSFFGLLALLALALPVWRTPNLASAGYLLLTGLMGGVAQIAMTRAYSLDNAARVAVVGYAGVVFTRLFAVPFFGEVPAPLQIFGSVLVIAAGLVLRLGR